MAFKCEPGRLLSVEEAREMVAYDNAKQPRPAEYDDVVFDNTSGTISGWRCKTAEEKRIGDEAAEDSKAASDAFIASRDKVLEAAGIDPATGVALRPQTFNTAVDGGASSGAASDPVGAGALAGDKKSDDKKADK